MLTKQSLSIFRDNPLFTAYTSGSAAGFLSLRSSSHAAVSPRAADGHPRGSLAAAPPLPKNLASLRSAAIFGSPVFSLAFACPPFAYWQKARLARRLLLFPKSSSGYSSRRNAASYFLGALFESCSFTLFPEASRQIGGKRQKRGFAFFVLFIKKKGCRLPSFHVGSLPTSGRFFYIE